MSTEPGWELLRTFLAVRRAGSLSGAARTLGLTQPTVGRQIAQLEAALGGALFTRSPQGLAPTERGQAIAPAAEAMEAAAQAVARAASGSAETAEGVVRITASEIVSAEVLPPMLVELRHAHPGLVFELAPSNATADLLRRDADIAVRMTPPRQEALLARKVGAIPLGLYAHADWLQRHGTPQSLDDLARQGMIGFDRDDRGARALSGVSLKGRDRPFDRNLFTLRCDSDLTQLAALRAGFGIGVCQVALARRTPDLRRVLEGEVDLSLETWVVMHEDLRTSRRVRLVFDHLVAGLTEYVRAAQP